MPDQPDTLSCPVCHLDGFDIQCLPKACERCGWRVELLIGQTSEAYRAKLSAAREAWSRRGAISEEPPDLARDPFEFAEEWRQRLCEAKWLAGRVSLKREDYDIKAQHYRLRPEWSDWTEQLAPPPATGLILKAERDLARDLFQSLPKDGYSLALELHCRDDCEQVGASTCHLVAGDGGTLHELEADASAGATGDELELDCGGGVMLKLKKLPAGSCMMGGEDDDAEQPVHKVTFTQPFYMGVHPVTQAQYEAVMDDNPSSFSEEPDSPRHPVERVSWEDAKKFCQKLAQKTGQPVRLPSEAEWEYACRAHSTGSGQAGSTTEYCFGDDEGQLELYGNYTSTPIYGGQSTSPVGSFRPNVWGLYDMHGNVWEWCEDKWHDDYQGAPTDGSPWLFGGDSRRVCRGGRWYGSAGGCRSAGRGGDGPGDRGNDLGFRLALFPAVH